MATRKVRYKKLSTKTALPVLREDQVDPSEYEALTTETQIKTGVEEAEENEYHLQVVLQGSAAAAADREIPVPPPQESDINYDELYGAKFEQPSNYIRFSQTVEECIGCQYDMTEEDDVFLKAYNQKRPASSRLSEDDFERIMEVFEETAAISTPFALVDNTVLPYDQMIAGLNELQMPKAMVHAKELHEFWARRRTEVGGPLHPTLKFETHQETDEMDPFVCFRRREVRQTRKTRARDIQSADKLKRLRREMEEARHLVLLARDREMFKRNLLLVDRAVYLQRAKLKEVKIRLGIRVNDEDLVNQKPQKRKAPDLTLSQRSMGAQIRASVRSDGRPAEQDLVQLTDYFAERENELRTDVIKRIENHRKWNEGYTDLTCEPLRPTEQVVVRSSYRTAKTQYLMTPPASVSSNDDDDDDDDDDLDGTVGDEPTPMELDDPKPAEAAAVATPPDSSVAVFEFKSAPSEPKPLPGLKRQFRRRYGRLNRLWIDRRRQASPPAKAVVAPGVAAGVVASVIDKLSSRVAMMDVDMDVVDENVYVDGDIVADRWKYDDDDSEDEPEVVEVDPYGIQALKFRASLPLSLPFPARRPELQTGSTNRPNGTGPPGGRLAIQAGQQQLQQQRPPATPTSAVPTSS